MNTPPPITLRVLRKIVVLLIVATAFTLVGAWMVHRRPPVDEPVFRFSLSTGADDSIQSRCVATWVTYELAITAAHCIPLKSRRIEIYHNDTTQAGTIETVFRHPTHDVALFRVDDIGPLRPPSIRFSHSVDTKKPFRVISSKYSSPSNDLERFDSHPIDITEISRTHHVVRFHSFSGCLKNGDSGTPLWQQLDDGERLAGLLISGSKGCKGVQTFVRSDRLISFLQEHRIL